MAVIDTGSSTSGKANVDTNYNLKVTLPTSLTQAGFGGLAAVNDDGTITGTPTVRRIWSTEAGHLIAALQDLYFDDTFNATAQNTAKWKFAATTQTVAQAGGFLTLNNGGSVAINTNSGVQTWRPFPIFGNHETRVTFSGGFATATDHVANGITEFGLFSADITTRVAPTDGVFFRYNASNELRGVISFAGSETQTAALTKPTTNVNHDWLIIVQNDVVSFWIDRIKVGTIVLTTDAPTLGQPFSAASQPVTIRQYIGGSGTGSAIKLQISDVFVKVVGPDAGRDWPSTKAGMGHMGYQGQNGGTMGSTANYANSANPAAAVPTNTTAALGTGLGGQFWETVTLAANSDGIIQSYQNPAGSTTQTPRNLIVHGITIHMYNQVALATVAFNKQYSLAFGHTAVSLATTEGTSFTTSPTTKAPRRIALGAIQPVAAVNTVYPQMAFRFQAPIAVHPGEFIALVSKNVGTVPATGVIAYNITYDCYWE